LKLESLEARQLLTGTLAGTVYYDADGSKNQDPREPGLAGWTVYLDKNANGKFDQGEPTSVTDRKGRYIFRKIVAADYLVGVVNGNSKYIQTSPGANGASRSQFHIKLNIRTGMNNIERRAFVEAAQKWESIIQSEPATSDTRATNNLLTIDAAVQKIDGVGRILGQAGPTAFRFDDDLPIKGSMMFDGADLEQMIVDGTLQSVILHEMGHVLGFGTIWDFKGLLTSTNNHHPKFTGATAASEYDQLFGTTVNYVPVDGDNGEGTAFAHWNEGILNEELMTGFAEDAGTPMPISRITVGQFKDLGYDVNMAAADDWNAKRHRTIFTTPLDLGVEANEYKITVTNGTTSSEVSFGYRPETPPKVRFGITTATGVAGKPVNLQTIVTDAENDGILGVTFYQESNGQPGLQTGHGGDTYIARRPLPSRGKYSTTAPSTSGTNTYYAVALDDVGFSSTKTATITLPQALRIVAAAYKPATGSIPVFNTSSLVETLDLTSPTGVTL